MSQLKKCKDCGEKKPLTDYYKGSSYKNKQYYLSRCKPCHKGKQTVWQKTNKKVVKKIAFKNNRKEGKGVYLVKYRWINFYVGEGNFYQRKNAHLTGNSPKASEVVKLHKERNLPRKYLSFHVLEYLDDKPTMLERETHYRRELKPYINPLD